MLAIFSVVYNLNGSTNEYIAAACAILLPFISLWLVIRFLAPSFNRRLLLISNTGNDTVSQTSINKKSNNRTSFSTSIARLITKPGMERMGFLFTWYMMARSRDFKMKVYPSIGYLLVYIVIIFLNGKGMSLTSIQQQSGEGRFVIIAALYFSSILLSMAITQLSYSEKYKAAWFYFITPVTEPGNILNGAIKAAVIKFFVPIIIILAIPGIVLMGISFLPNLLLAIVNQLFICYFIVYASQKDLPFSKPQSMQAKAGNFIRSIFRLIIPLLIAVLHYFIYASIPLLALAIIVDGAALWLIAGLVKKLTWDIVKTTYTED